MNYLELVQGTLQHHKYTLHFYDYKCDVVQLILCFHPGNREKNLIANRGTWSQFKHEADIIDSILNQWFIYLIRYPLLINALRVTFIFLHAVHHLKTS